jgi:hypothetical protein
MAKTSITLRLADHISNEVKERASNRSTTITEYLTGLITRGLQFEENEGTDYRGKIKELEEYVERVSKSEYALENEVKGVRTELENKVSSLRLENASIRGEVDTLKEVVLAGISKK